MVEPDEYILVWDFLQGERQKITIKRMVYLDEEEDYLTKKKIREKISGGNTESITKDAQYKINQEKFFLTAEIRSFDEKKGWFRGKGFSIHRYQLPKLISALQNIYDGKCDAETDFKISEFTNNEKNTGFNIQRYNKWKNKQNDDLKKEIWKMEQMGMDKESIYKAMNPKNYDDD